MIGSKAPSSWQEDSVTRILTTQAACALRQPVPVPAAASDALGNPIHPAEPAAADRTFR